MRCAKLIAAAVFPVPVGPQIKKTNSVKELQKKFKTWIRNRGGLGIRSFGVIFRQFDHNGNKKLDIHEFTEALNACG